MSTPNSSAEERLGATTLRVGSLSDAMLRAECLARGHEDGLKRAETEGDFRAWLERDVLDFFDVTPSPDAPADHEAPLVWFSTPALEVLAGERGIDEALWKKQPGGRLKLCRLLVNSLKGRDAQ